jgi:hypothetical protein
MTFCFAIFAFSQCLLLRRHTQNEGREESDENRKISFAIFITSNPMTTRFFVDQKSLRDEIISHKGKMMQKNTRCECTDTKQTMNVRKSARDLCHGQR